MLLGWRNSLRRMSPFAKHLIKRWTHVFIRRIPASVFEHIMNPCFVIGSKCTESLCHHASSCLSHLLHILTAEHALGRSHGLFCACILCHNNTCIYVTCFISEIRLMRLVPVVSHHLITTMLSFAPPSQTSCWSSLSLKAENMRVCSFSLKSI